MKYGVFSDIHGNLEAFLNMLKELKDEGVDGYICCGDLAGYYYEQEEVAAQLQQLSPLFMVAGNHDMNYLKANKEEDLRQAYSLKYGNSYINTYSPSLLQFLEALPSEITTVVNGRKVGIFHGSVENPIQGRIYPDCTSFDGKYQQYDICFLGHTHYQMAKQVGNTLILNPGSLGQPRDSKGFSYCIFDFENMTYRFRTVKINKDALKQQVLLYETAEDRIKYLISVLDRGE